MASKTETGHAKNVATFEDIISFAKGLKEKYNPSKESIKIVSLEALYKKAKEALSQAKTTEIDFNNATNKRANLFSPIRKLSTRLVAASVVFTDAETVKDIKAINRKIQGIRASKPTSKQEEGQPAPADKKISTSQQSYDSLIDHIDKMIESLGAQAAYLPNETELSVPGLKNTLQLMQQANSEVINAYTKWSNSRIARNVTLYNALQGLVATAADVKNYIKSAFGFTSPEYKQMTGLKFTRPKG